MILIVGLGNPGLEYENTRHNSGFKVIDAFADELGIDVSKEKCKGLYGKFKLDDEDVFLLKPQTYMNLSGTCVQEFVHFFKIPVENIVVVYDDMAINVGDIRLKLNGSSAGQKGIQNIIENLGTQEIKRIKIGIGEPSYNAIDHVLGKPSGNELALWEKAISKAVLALKEFLRKDFHNAMSKYNGGGNI